MDAFVTPTVWLVDDDEDDQRFICSAFLAGDSSIQVRILDDGGELLPALLTCWELPRVILLDINMPPQNGFETLAGLLCKPAFIDLPVIRLTTSSADEDQQRSLDLGANQFLTKPLSYQQLRQMAQVLHGVLAKSVSQLANVWKSGLRLTSNQFDFLPCHHHESERTIRHPAQSERRSD